MSEELDRVTKTARERRKVTSDKHTAKAKEGETNTEKFRVLWDAACPEHRGSWGGHRDMMHAKEKIAALKKTVDDLPAFLEWIVKEWHSLKFRTGTDWMAKRNMIPRWPEMRFVLHHWSHFHAAYGDRAEQKAHDYVSPEVEALREDLGFLEAKLREVAKFGQEAQLLRLRNENERIKIENTRLRAQLAPFVDLDTDLPTWEEREDAKV